MIDIETQNRYLEKVISSNTFSSSQINKELLEYLVRSTQSGNHPKEITIALEALGKTADFDPSNDPYVRSRMFKLREKLAHYYQTEGKDDEVEIVIPKGAYHVEFRSHQSDKADDSKSFTPKRWYYVCGVLAISLLANIYFAAVKKAPLEEVRKHRLWKDILHSDFPVLFVQGDYLTFVEIENDLPRLRVIRDHVINSEEQFLKFDSLYPGRPRFIEKDYRSMNWTAMENFLTLSKIFHLEDKRILTKTSSKVQWDDLRNFDIVYEGAQITLYKLLGILNPLKLRIDPLRPPFITQVDDKGDTVEVFQNIQYADNEIGHVILTKLPGPNRNTYLFIISHFEMGRNYLTHKLLDKSFLDELDQMLMQNCGAIPRYFEVLYKVEGVTRSGFHHEILYANKLSIW